MELHGSQKSAVEEAEYAYLLLEGFDAQGDALAVFEGQTINVFGGIPGEEVKARIVRYRKRRRQCISAIVEEVITPSPHRIAPLCPYFGPCSGCQWQHIEYSHQLEIKRDAVEKCLHAHESLKNVLVLPTLPSPQVFNYRNHARFTIRNSGTLGFMNRITYRFTRVDECMLMAPWINEALGQLQDKSAETSQLSIRYGINTGDFLIQPTMDSPEISLPTGQPHYEENLGGRAFRVASPSFFQVNTAQAERMMGLVKDCLELCDRDTLLDAYAGVGTFAVLLAPYVRKVIAIEESASAVKDAELNAAGIENLEFVQSKTEDALDSLEETSDAVILDPPRIGCHEDAIRAIVRLRPPRLAYVSCDPSSLARDLNLLVQGGYDVKDVQPLDMFPQTHHVECLASLRHQKAT